MPLVHLSIGSNKGDRLGYIDRAVALISFLAGTVTAVSEPVESEPWGFESTNRFINVGINIDTPLTPLQLLDTLQSIERTISSDPHRNPDGTYRDRSVDIDIILYRGVSIDTPRLTIPHPNAAQRQFVMQPLQAIWPYNIDL
ncbi:MAG: 2-amino-4-hydroxy-6-hydroxymethyldihydropteridine diphosphokinase [Muribaculaceae bacterium]|nr:2-amino-4-hydroxy-6-hydroxymethyldihydropteridine diphosphokinase [Muribaculaceae bacterium]